MIKKLIFNVIIFANIAYNTNNTMEQNKVKVRNNIIKTIVVGSTNKNKVEAVKEIIKQYDFLTKAEVKSVEVSSMVSDQPLSLEETIQGAINRAKNSFKNCDLSVGIESGLFKVPLTQTGYMNICVCAFYDGNEYYIGLSSAFECPIEITRLMVEEKLDMNQAFYKLNLTNKAQLGLHEGAVGLLTNGRVNRLDYSKQAIIMALIRLENQNFFKNIIKNNEKN